MESQMTLKLVLRLATVFLFFHLLGHMVGASTWKDNPDRALQQTIKGMEQNKFEFMWARQSLAGHHDGYGYASALALLFFSVLIWVVSEADESSKALSTRVVLICAVTLVLWGVLEIIYFFPFAAAFTLVAAALCAYAFVILKRA